MQLDYWIQCVISWTMIGFAIAAPSQQQQQQQQQQEVSQDLDYWYEQARIALRKRLQYANDRRPHAKNVILFVGDGMGVATVTAARILRGQRQGKQGEEHELAWDAFPAVALAKTYNMDAQVGESSACATALMCGVKTNFETVGLDARGRFENCFSSFSSRVPSLIDWAQESGKSTGIVTNTRITHATPAALYGHSPSRYWEDDSKVPPASRKSCKDLARQLIENDPGRNINKTTATFHTNFIIKRLEMCSKDNSSKFFARITSEKGKQYLDFDITLPTALDDSVGHTSFIQSSLDGKNFVHLFTMREKNLCKSLNTFTGEFWYDIERAAQVAPGVCPIPKVILGGGRRHWMPKVARDPEQTKEEGRRLDGRNLIDDWVRDKKKRGLKAEYAWNKGQLDKINPNHVDYLLGLFSYSHMDFEVDRDPGPTGDPSLADMTRSALSILVKNPKGFFLFVEGGRIDHAHHYNNAYRALDETLAMETALLAALSMVNPAETLIVVTSDHSHVLTMGGQATPRGHPILGPDSKVSDIDGQPYSTLLYGNGPGYSTPRTIPINTTTQNEDRNQVHGSAVPRQWATHGGEDVPVYALGPLATTLFTGTFDQSYIPHAIAYSACLGEHAQRCQGIDNYTACIVPEVSSVSAAGSPVVIASSVMADDGARTKSAATRDFAFSYTLCIVVALNFAVT